MDIWSYLMVALCASVTSAGVIDFPGNRDGFHGNLISGAKEEKVLTPPSDNGLIIDSNGFPGNSNDEGLDCKELCVKNKGGDSCMCDWPPFLKDILTSLSSQKTVNNGYQIIQFTKDDIINMQDSDLCKTMCEYGVEKPPCKCK